MSIILGDNQDSSRIITPDQMRPEMNFAQMIAQIAANVAVDVFERLSVSKVNIKYKKLTETATQPTYSTDDDTCADLYADEECIVEPYSVNKISTGISFEAPKGFYLRILSRSGLASKGIMTTGGVIDNGYRGDVMVLLYNSTSEPYKVNKGDRIAQIEIRNFHQMQIEEVSELSETERNDQGFGAL